MNQERQVEIVKQFMLVIGPELARHKLAQFRRHSRINPMDEDYAATFWNQAPADLAKLTLQWAMHLAGQYATCYDEAVYAPQAPPEATVYVHPSSHAVARVHPHKEGLDH